MDYFNNMNSIHVHLMKYLKFSVLLYILDTSNDEHDLKSYLEVNNFLYMKLGYLIDRILFSVLHLPKKDSVVITMLSVQDSLYDPLLFYEHPNKHSLPTSYIQEQELLQHLFELIFTTLMM